MQAIWCICRRVLTPPQEAHLYVAAVSLGAPPDMMSFAEVHHSSLVSYLAYFVLWKPVLRKRIHQLRPRRSAPCPTSCPLQRCFILVFNIVESIVHQLSVAAVSLGAPPDVMSFAEVLHAIGIRFMFYVTAETCPAK